MNMPLSIQLIAIAFVLFFATPVLGAWAFWASLSMAAASSLALLASVFRA